MITLGFSAKLTFFVIAIVMCIGALNVLAVYFYSKQKMQETLATELRNIVNVGSLQLDMRAHENIFYAEDGIEGLDDLKQLQQQLVAIMFKSSLQSVQGASPIYTLRKSHDFINSQTLDFVVMSHKNKAGDFYTGNSIPIEPFQQRAFLGRTATTGLYQDKEGTWISAAAPLRDASGQVIGILQADYHVEQFQAQLGAFLLKLIIATLLISLLAALAALVWARHFVKAPLNTLSNAIDKISQGDLKHRITLKGHDELSAFGKNFNKMTALLDAAQRELKMQNQNLEQTVEKRTKALAESLKVQQDSEQKLLKHAKLASIGQLAAGVAHEVNNPMAFISGNVSALKRYLDNIKSILVDYDNYVTVTQKSLLPDEQKVFEHLQRRKVATKLDFILSDFDLLIEDSIGGVERVTNIVQSLKNYSRVDRPEKEKANINDCLESTLHMVWSQLKSHCVLHKDLNELPEINCYPGEINQVFTNLLVNAGQAIEKEGEITVATRHTAKEIIVKISDNGTGIEKEHLDKLFDPFFTTKPVGVGTGLGLSISYGIIEKHQGDIIVNSEVGRGTTFEVRLPCS